MLLSRILRGRRTSASASDKPTRQILQMSDDQFLKEPGGHFPPAFDEAFYKAQAKDLHGDMDPRYHFDTYGRAAGLPGSTGCSKRALVERIYSLKPSSALEIGPGCNPILSGDGVFYFDVKSREQLFNRYRNTEHADKVPSEIHFVHPDGDLSQIPQKFSLVISSHVIEHTADLIDHFAAVSGLLEEGGYYVLLVPDKRYCFDHFKNETQFEEVLSQHYVGDGGWARFLNCYLLENTRRAHNEAARHWDDDHGEFEVDKAKIERALETARSVYENPVERFGFHNWFFTDRSFDFIVSRLARTRLIDLEPIAVYNTVRKSFEFSAVLRKPRSN